MGIINDVELEETEIFVANTASLYPDPPIGVFNFTKLILTDYWDGQHIDGVTIITLRQS
jgi:hypothetical protein